MTIQQEAYRLIDGLAEENVKILVELMKAMNPSPEGNNRKTDGYESVNRATKEERMRAFERMQELRKLSASCQLGDPESEREAYMREKYGDFSSAV